MHSWKERKRAHAGVIVPPHESPPVDVVQVVVNTEDADQLAMWLSRFATATDLDSIGIVSRKRK